jgi:hypothetical protein
MTLLTLPVPILFPELAPVSVALAPPVPATEDPTAPPEAAEPPEEPPPGPPPLPPPEVPIVLPSRVMPAPVMPEAPIRLDELAVSPVTVALPLPSLDCAAANVVESISAQVDTTMIFCVESSSLHVAGPK